MTILETVLYPFSYSFLPFALPESLDTCTKISLVLKQAHNTDNSGLLAYKRASSSFGKAFDVYGEVVPLFA